MIVGVDIGTSVTKASIIHRDGRVGPTSSMRSSLVTAPGGRVEQDLGEVLTSVATVVRAALAENAASGDSSAVGSSAVGSSAVGSSAVDSSAVEAVAITGQGDGLWLRDATGAAVRPPISWMDARAASIVDDWRSGGDGSVIQRLYARTGSGVFPGSHAALLAWMHRNEPESLRRATVAGYCVDAIVQNLTGAITVDASDASLPFLTVATREYDDAALELCGLSEWKHLLPSPAAPGAMFTLDARGSELLGLPEGTAVTGGPYDLQACGFGAGTTRRGEGTLVVGTTLSCQVLTTDTTIDPAAEPAGMWLCTPDPDLYLRVMPSMVGTASIDWLLSLFGLAPADLNDLLLQSPVGANGVHALSFLSPSGERAPFVDPFARGQFSGLSLGATRSDLTRALCEGLAYAARHCFDELGLDGDVSACGGGLQSTEWAQIFCDVIGRPLLLPDDAAVGARGAAMVAWAALGTPVDEELWRSQRRRIEPDPDRSAAYELGYARYRADLDDARTHWSGTRS